MSDNEKRHVLAVFLFDYLENCEIVKGIYNYRNVNLIFTDVSNLENFDSLIHFFKSINLKKCKDYINIPGPDRIDYNAYYYLYDKEDIKYTNEKKLIYKDGSVVLRTIF